MFKLLGGLSVYFKYQEIRTDNAVFRLHNIFTTVLLLMCSMIITATQYVGQPIQCIVSGLPTHVVNTFCWITSTFTMPDEIAREVGREVAHPGVFNEYDSTREKKYHTYYQWVCFVLFFQAIMCYTPKFLWDAFEGGLLRTIVMGLNVGACHVDEREKKKDVLIGYLLRYAKRHKMYAFRYWGCELLCLVNIVLQLLMMDSFFGGEFFSYGVKVLGYSEVPQEQRMDPMIYVFPRVTKCTFHKYGASGSIQTHDSLCILPLNIVNEKTYIFLWFWYIILAVMLCLLVVYRLVIICVPSIRARLLHARARSLAMETAVVVSTRTDVGDWWILYMLARNMDPLIYRELISELAKRMGEKAGARA
ncbi:Innexin inx1 [Plutella xylostella]|uniref:Innexin n=1 Tax=Plutella xylostella TaxID=51655 RepID=A0ABQ7QFH8_PLUXY|nr:innexin inx1 [Plutella xylostella]KAG7303830.1 Innexin inx1 [Plutella xylostella]